MPSKKSKKPKKPKKNITISISNLLDVQKILSEIPIYTIDRQRTELFNKILEEPQEFEEPQDPVKLRGVRFMV